MGFTPWKKAYNALQLINPWDFLQIFYLRLGYGDSYDEHTTEFWNTALQLTPIMHWHIKTFTSVCSYINSNPSFTFKDFQSLTPSP